MFLKKKKKQQQPYKCQNCYKCPHPGEKKNTVLSKEHADHSKHTAKSNNIGDDSTHGHHKMSNTKVRLIIYFAAEDVEALYSQPK